LIAAQKKLHGDRVNRPTARVSGLVGEPANETEKSVRLDSSIFARPTTKSAAVLARFRVVRLVMQNQKTSLTNIFAIKFYPSRLSRKNLIALFMKEQPV
jgi:hypothetical protein